MQSMDSDVGWLSYNKVLVGSKERDTSKDVYLKNIN